MADIKLSISIITLKVNTPIKKKKRLASWLKKEEEEEEEKE